MFIFKWIWIRKERARLKPIYTIWWPLYNWICSFSFYIFFSIWQRIHIAWSSYGGPQDVICCYKRKKRWSSDSLDNFYFRQRIGRCYYRRDEISIKTLLLTPLVIYFDLGFICGGNFICMYNIDIDRYCFDVKVSEQYHWHELSFAMFNF